MPGGEEMDGGREAVEGLVELLCFVDAVQVLREDLLQLNQLAFPTHEARQGIDERGKMRLQAGKLAENGF